MPSVCSLQAIITQPMSKDAFEANANKDRDVLFEEDKGPIKEQIKKVEERVLYNEG